MIRPEQRRLEDWQRGGKRAIAELFSYLEQEKFPTFLASILDAALTQPHGVTIGVTGPPGAGKSTLIGGLITYYQQQGLGVGVIAVDPSSRLTGGAILGDRTRFSANGSMDRMFVRSMAARERLGGLAPATGAALFFLRSVYDVTLVETVGVGQSETDIARLADLVLMCTPPAAGDRLQFIKSGLLEIPDIVALTKSDMVEIADHTYAELRSGLRSAAAGGKAAPIVRVSDRDPASVEKLATNLQDVLDQNTESGILTARRKLQGQHWLEDALRDQFGRRGVALLGQRALEPGVFQLFGQLTERLEAHFADLMRDQLV